MRLSDTQITSIKISKLVISGQELLVIQFLLLATVDHTYFLPSTMEDVPIIKFELCHKALLKERMFIKQDKGRAISVPQFPYPKERIEAFEKLISWCINNNVQALRDALQYNVEVKRAGFLKIVS